MAVTAVPFARDFTREECYAIAIAFNPAMRHELLDGKIYALPSANPPHAGIVNFLNHRFGSLDEDSYSVVVHDVLEIEPSGAPEPDVTIVKCWLDFYRERHPNGGDALLVVEVGDTERNPREKMRAYMRDGRIRVAWRIDIPSRTLEVWEAPHLEPVAILSGEERIDFGGSDIVIGELFAALPWRAESKAVQVTDTGPSDNV